MDDPGGAEGLAAVPASYEDAVREATEEGPGGCIFIEERSTTAGRLACALVLAEAEGIRRGLTSSERWAVGPAAGTGGLLLKRHRARQLGRQARPCGAEAPVFWRAAAVGASRG